MTLLNKMVGNEIFLQGKYLAVGVNSSGDIGTRYAAPAGYETDLAYARVGLLGDTDGFGTGKAAMRDAIIRGAPIEGFNIGYKVGGSTFIHSNQELDGLTEIAGKASNGSSKTVAEADWKGATNEKLAVDQKITLTENAKYVRFEVTLTNNSSASMSDLRYMRTMDPDLGDNFKTVNTIVKQGADGALITAAASASGNPMFLYADDPRAVVSSYGFINESPYESAVATARKVGTTTTDDTSINLNFSLGTLGAGKATTVVFYMGVTDNLKATIAEIDSHGTPSKPTTPPPTPTNTAPDAINDTLAIGTGETGKGNVLANDKDGDGDALTAKLKTGPSHGTVTLAADGSYVYKAAGGYVGSDSFTYTASDGKASDVATVSIKVAAAPVVTPPATTPGLPNSPLVKAANTVNGSASTSDTLKGVAQHNSFYFDLGAKSGDDKIANFGEHDILVTKGALYDGNKDGTIAIPSSILALDGAGSADSVAIAGVSALRFLGTDAVGLSVYANGGNKPDGAIEGKIANDVLIGDSGNSKQDTFFFDTALDIDLGDDRIGNFGDDDLLVTTSALSTTALGRSGVVKLVGGSGDKADTLTAGESGTIDLNAIGGAAVQKIEFDGSVAHDGVTYYVYSLAGSHAGAADLHF